MSRNGYMLQGKLAQRGYDWWWHSLVGVSKRSGLPRPFFIEYFVINPGLGGAEPILGQLPENQRQGIRPSYAMLKVGSWGEEDAVQIHNFYGIQDFAAATERMDVRISSHVATETHLKGAVELSEQEAAQHPEYMSDAGSMSWDLSAEKVLSFNLGWATSKLFRSLNAFQMYWHVEGMRTRYQGTIVFNGEEFEVTPETSYGYQDKNWGQTYSNPWVWLNCNYLTSNTTGEKLALTSLDVGGARAIFFGIPLPRGLIIAFYHEGKLYDFSFSSFWLLPRQRFDVQVAKNELRWDITASTILAKIEIAFTCPKDTMQWLNYENPDGEWKHRQLWNGGYVSGTVNLYRRAGFGFEHIDTFNGAFGGCEYGIY